MTHNIKVKIDLNKRFKNPINQHIQQHDKK